MLLLVDPLLGDFEIELLVLGKVLFFNIVEGDHVDSISYFCFILSEYASHGKLINGTRAWSIN